MTRLVLSGLLVLLVASCGYRPLGQGDFPDGVNSVQVVIFENRTYEPLLEDVVTNQVIEEFSRRHGMRVVTQDADARLKGVVTEFRADALSYDTDDRIGQFRATVAIEAVLSSLADGRVLWKGALSWSQNYPINMDKSVQEENEAAAVRFIAKRLAENLYYRIQQDF